MPTVAYTNSYIHKFSLNTHRETHTPRMESLTSTYLPIGISGNILRTKKSPFLPVSAAFTKNNKPPPSSSPPPQKVAATETLSTTTSSSRTPIVTRDPVMEPNALLSLQMAFSNAFKGLIKRFNILFLHMPFSSDEPYNILPGNFAPVDELPPTRCPVIHGSIPPCLAGGAYIRNGPNPQFLQHGPNHLFDGDGMLHSLLFSEDGGARLCSRYVKTYRYCLEHEHGDIVMLKIFSSLNGLAGVASRVVNMARVLTGQMDPTQGIGMANTSVVIIGGCLYALGEPDLPYAVHVDPVTGEISTIGRCDFEGQMVMGMTAHPKKDPVTGEMFAFCYAPMPPYLTYFHFDPAGNKSADVPIVSVQQPSFIHDFAITENYVLFNDFQLEMKLLNTLLGSGPPVSFNGGKVSRLGVLPRYATDDSNIRWFDVPGFNMVHSINAWEEECVNGENFLVLVALNMLNIEHMLEKMELVHSCVEMVRINLTTGILSRKPLSVGNLDLGVIHPGYVGRQNRYAYLGHGKPLPKIYGVAKLDFSLAGTRDCVVASRDFGPGCLGGEPFFVPKDGSEEEDDGYLLSYVHHEDTGESRFVVMDARSPKLDIVAEVVLPHRVPYGFHGLFISKTELLSQR